AITLVLSSVFLPVLFVPGLTGQFYRQFAVTIATAMIISALNALTLTPSRAVSIFRSEEKDPVPSPGRQTEKDRAPKRAALPWWIFGVVGGRLTVWIGQAVLAGPMGFPAPGQEGISAGAGWAVWAAYFVPGLLLGLLLGWFIIKPVNAGLGWFFGRFNGLFSRITAGYSWINAKLL